MSVLARSCNVGRRRRYDELLVAKNPVSRPSLDYDIGAQAINYGQLTLRVACEASDRTVSHHTAEAVRGVFRSRQRAGVMVCRGLDRSTARRAHARTRHKCRADAAFGRKRGVNAPARIHLVDGRDAFVVFALLGRINLCTHRASVGRV